MPAAKCQATTKKGEPCPWTAVADGWCRAHDPNGRDKLRAAAVLGGAASSKRARALKSIPEAMTAEQAAGWVSRLLVDVVEGRAEPKIAVAAATLAKTLVELRKFADWERRMGEFDGADDTDDDNGWEMPKRLLELPQEEFKDVFGQAIEQIKAHRDEGQALAG